MTVEKVSKFQEYLTKVGYGDNRKNRTWLEAYYNAKRGLIFTMDEATKEQEAKLFENYGWNNHAEKLRNISFKDFYNIIKDSDNINVASIEGGDIARYNYMKQLLKKSGLDSIISLSEPERTQANVYGNNGNIEIEVMGHKSNDGLFIEIDNNTPYRLQPKTNCIATYIIDKSFNVTPKFKDYNPSPQRI